MTAVDARARSLRLRWERIAVGIRCAYNPCLPPVILHYLESGRRLVDAGVMEDAVVQRRMLTVLLQSAGDEALPCGWRCACLKYAVHPRARLVSLLDTRDPGAVRNLDDEVQWAQERLEAALLTGLCVSARVVK